MTDHPLTETAAEITDEMVEVAVRAWLGTATGTDEGDMRAALSTALAVATPADPHHDPRPWQDCTRKDIHKGDLVETLVGGRLIVAVAHHQDENGNWWTEGGNVLTYDDHWPLRRIPAHTPPAEEVEMPGERPAHLLDVMGVDGDVCDHTALDRFFRWRGVDQDGVLRDWSPHSITAFTLPDGTRARRDGEHADGTPRFVKTREGEK